MNFIKGNKIYPLQLQTILSIQRIHFYLFLIKYLYALKNKTSLDSLGNEGPLSETKEIVFPVSPVRNLTLEKLDNAAPYITWQAPSDGTITGYYIYRNGSRITQYPVTALSYTDGYYSGGSVTYGISAVNDLGNEGPAKEVILPDLSIGIVLSAVRKVVSDDFCFKSLPNY